MAERKKVGIVLFQLGGPDSLDAVQPFLFNLFNDPDIIEIPLGRLLRKPLARFIAWRRRDKIAHHYEEIGGRSPILPLTERQARALENKLASEFDARAFVAMRYWRPFTAQAVAELSDFAPDEIVLLPLYPHYSFATTGSSLNEWKRQYRESGCPVRLVREFYSHPLYIDAVIERISSSLTQFERLADVDLVFSAHGLPVSFVERGDPYPKQIEETVRLVMQRGGWAVRHCLCYQSKVGPQKWIGPSLDDTIHRLATEGRKRVLICPIAFVTEHIETLHEINIETREEAEELGIQQFEMVPSLNDSPKFIAALADLVQQAICSREPAAEVKKHV